jgi:hypothetical protein
MVAILPASSEGSLDVLIGCQRLMAFRAKYDHWALYWQSRLPEDGFGKVKN